MVLETIRNEVAGGRPLAPAAATTLVAALDMVTTQRDALAGDTAELAESLDRATKERDSLAEQLDVWRFLAIGRRIIDAGGSVDAAITEFVQRLDAVPPAAEYN